MLINNATLSAYVTPGRAWGNMYAFDWQNVEVKQRNAAKAVDGCFLKRVTVGALFKRWRGIRTSKTASFTCVPLQERSILKPSALSDTRG